MFVVVQVQTVQLRVWELQLLLAAVEEEAAAQLAERMQMVAAEAAAAVLDGQSQETAPELQHQDKATRVG